MNGHRMGKLLFLLQPMVRYESLYSSFLSKMDMVESRHRGRSHRFLSGLSEINEI